MFLAMAAKLKNWSLLGWYLQVKLPFLPYRRID
jgi:hypothetical protein